MTFAIRAGGTLYYTSHGASVEAVLASINSGTVLPCFWYGESGQRFSEDIWFSPDDVKLVRSESRGTPDV